MSTSHAPAESALTCAPPKGKTPTSPPAPPGASKSAWHRANPAVLRPAEEQRDPALRRDRGPAPCTSRLMMMVSKPQVLVAVQV